MTQQTATVQAEPRLSDLVDHLVQFDGPPDQFLLHLLAVQCHVGSAEGGAIVRAGSTANPEILAVFPPPENETAPSWLAQAIEILPRSLTSTETVVAPVSLPNQLYGQGPEAFLLLIPLRGGSGVRGAAVFMVAASDAEIIRQCRQRLELTVSLLSLYEMRLTLQSRRADLQRLRDALEVLSAVNELDRFKATAMAFCNELATLLSAERVSVGFHKGRYVCVEGMSHTEKVVRKMELVQSIESAMEECLDQDEEIIHPAVAEATYVSRAAGELAARHGPTTICCLPLRRAGEPEGVLAVERSVDRPYTIEEAQVLRLVADLCTARLLELREHDRWVGAKAAGAMRKGFVALLGPRHTWVKVAVVGVCAAILFLSLYPADWRVQAPFEIKTVEHQVIAAPFTGRLDTINVKMGDPVVAGETILITMETAELKAQLASAEAREHEYQTKADLAQKEGKTADKQIAQHQMAQAVAEQDLLKHNIANAEIRSQISGVVTEGDLEGSEGATYEQGDPLFRVAPIDTLRAELLVSEKRIIDVLAMIEGQPQDGAAVGAAPRKHGDLAAVASPGDYLPFIVEDISRVAETIEQRNVFRVRVRLVQMDERPRWLAPGIEGVAKVHIGKATYAWLWSRDVVDWVRMKLWW